MEQGLTPAMALRACNLPDSDKPKLSRQITTAVYERAQAEVALERRIQSVEASSNNNNRSHDEEPPKRSKNSSSSASSTAATTTSTISPIPLPSSAPAQKPPPDHATSSAYHISHTHSQFTAPYLQKGRKQGSHFRKKVESKKEELRKQGDGACITPVPKNNIVKKSRKSSLQKNTEWVNDKSLKDDHDQRFSAASTEAIAAFSAKKQGKDTGWGTASKQAIVNGLNKKYSLDGEGKEGSREQGKLTLRTVDRWVETGRTEPPKKGRAQKIDRSFLRLVALHANMCQVGMTGEVDPKYLKGTLLAAVLGTEHEQTFHLEYAWEQCRRDNCEILQPSGRILAEDIRWQWVTHSNLVEFFDQLKVS